MTACGALLPGAGVAIVVGGALMTVGVLLAVGTGVTVAGGSSGFVPFCTSWKSEFPSPSVSLSRGVVPGNRESVQCADAVSDIRKQMVIES